MRSHESYADGWADAMQWAADHMRDAEDKAAAADILSSVADHWAEMQTEDYRTRHLVLVPRLGAVA